MNETCGKLWWNSLSNSNNNSRVDTVTHDQEITGHDVAVDVNSVNSKTSADNEYDVDNTSELSIVCPTVKRTFTHNLKKNCNDISGHLIGNKEINMHSIKGNIIQNENTEINISSIPKRLSTRMKVKVSGTEDVINHNDLCCKISIAIAVFGTIGCCLIPIILYYISQAADRSNSVTDPGYPYEKNTSAIKVCWIYKNIVINIL